MAAAHRQPAYVRKEQRSPFLKKMGIRTIGDLAQTDLTMVESWLKSHGRLLWEYANGLDDSAVVSQPAKAKGVGNSTTISHDVTTAKEAYEILRKLAESVSGRLKKKQFLARQVSTEIKYATFQSVSHQTTLLSATADAQEIYRQACGLFDELWDGRGDPASGDPHHQVGGRGRTGTDEPV